MKNLIELSLLPRDTGKPDVFSASPEPPLPKQEERKGEEKKSQKRKEKNQKRQEESGLSSQEKKEPQKSQRGGQGKRERQESESEQVSPPPPGSIAPHFTHKKCLRSELWPATQPFLSRHREGEEPLPILYPYHFRN